MNNTALYVIGAGTAGYVAAYATAEPSSAHVLGAAAAAGAAILSESIANRPSDLDGDAQYTVALLKFIYLPVSAGLGTGLAVGVVTKDVGASVGAGLIAGIATAILFVVGEKVRSMP